jgi:hypothetical protein
MSRAVKLELTTTELLEHGWSRTLIKRFLPRPDGCVPVDHWANFRGQDTYSAIKVWNIEQSAEFEVAFLKTWKGRSKRRMKDTSPETVLADMREAPHPKVPKRTKKEIQRDTVVMEAAAVMKEMRARGYRTPHKT